ncbi:spermidine synthase [Solihabitans fulvus]|uniref:Polyamine aminopropyltransferase n=1 Tax=Solihabitans fulvus TaxID=1892852 RepID=A0A5B2X7P0_9PSEU|nr:spermidine synthase [Solihabitans fulvus]KAA2258902.1 spermidine synthase [Solihabitans fulvus]
MVRLWDLDEVLVETDTAYQHLLIGRTSQGVSLFCDNDRQSTEFSQLVYHEALMVPALLLADRVDRVLVIGSSEGVVCQMATAAGASLVDHVDIDEQAVRLCAEHLPYGYTNDELAAAERGDGAVRVHFTDGWEFLRKAAEGTDRYDIVLVDLPDEREDDAQHNRLYGEEFLRMCRSVLAPGGVVVSQAGCQTMWRNGTLLRSWQRFTDVFGTVAYYGSDEHEWAYLFGRADEVADPTATMIERLPASGYRPVSIDADALRGCSIPPYSVRHNG